MKSRAKVIMQKHIKSIPDYQHPMRGFVRHGVETISTQDRKLMKSARRRQSQARKITRKAA